VIAINYPGHGEKIAKMAGALLHPHDQTVARVNDNGELLGGVIFTNYTGASICIHVGAFRPNWINRNMLYATFAYPFLQLGVNKVIGQVGKHNEKAVKFNTSVGFTLETTVKDVFPEGDMLIMTMYKEDCRHLRIVPRNWPADVMTFDTVR